jgi:hypothetical protein
MSKAELIPFYGAIKSLQATNRSEKQVKEDKKGLSRKGVLGVGVLATASLACTTDMLRQYFDPLTIYKDEENDGQPAVREDLLPTSLPHDKGQESFVEQGVELNNSKTTGRSKKVRNGDPGLVEETVCFPQPDESKTFKLGDKYIVGQREGFSDNVDFTDSWGAPIEKVGVNAEQVGDQGDPCYRLTMKQQILIATAALGRRLRAALKLENIDSGSVNPREALID